MRKLIKVMASVLLAAATMMCAIWVTVAQPTFGRNQQSSLVVDQARLKKHVVTFAVENAPRNWLNTQNLARCASYIGDHFTKAGARCKLQEFNVGGRRYQNVIGIYGPEAGPRLIIGAHYDSYNDTPGADDNASGVAALIELAYLLDHSKPKTTVELVAYTLEEPPYFRTPQMGSAHHAGSLSDQNVQVTGVIVLEMVGYFSDQPSSQSYPASILRLMYPAKGNFISIIGRWDQGDWISRIKTGMKGATELPVYSVRAPESLPGSDFSDHLNYWALGYPAVMITDTAYFRNQEYHGVNDTPERLDYKRLSQVVIAVFESVKML